MPNGRRAVRIIGNQGVNKPGCKIVLSAGSMQDDCKEMLFGQVQCVWMYERDETLLVGRNGASKRFGRNLPASGLHCTSSFYYDHASTHHRRLKNGVHSDRMCAKTSTAAFTIQTVWVFRMRSRLSRAVGIAASPTGDRTAQTLLFCSQNKASKTDSEIAHSTPTSPHPMALFVVPRTHQWTKPQNSNAPISHIHCISFRGLGPHFLIHTSTLTTTSPVPFPTLLSHFTAYLFSGICWSEPLSLC